MRFTKNLCLPLVLTLTTTFSFNPALAANKNASATFSPEQQQAIQKIVHDYLIAQPEVLLEASQALQDKELAKNKAQALQGITKNKQQLFNNPNSPVGGNADGNVILVEFFDYQCGHCKEMQPALDSLMAKNKNLKVIYKEFPIFGASSNLAAQMALAAIKQNKYVEFHNALFKLDGSLNENKITEAAKSVGLNVDQLKTDMNAPAIKQELADNYNLARALSLVGTPSFVLANKDLTNFDFIPGGVPEKDLQQSIDKLAPSSNAKQ